MFVSERVLLPVPLRAAQFRLANAIAAGTLLSAARQAYDEPGTALAALDEHGTAVVRVGPLAGLPGVSRLVRVHFRDPVSRGETAVLTLRWDAEGPGGGMFPALDADITLAAAGEDAATMTLDGAYRPPLGQIGAGLDRMLLHRAATATIRRFLELLAQTIVAPASSHVAAPSGAPAQAPIPWLPPVT